MSTDPATPRPLTRVDRAGFAALGVLIGLSSLSLLGGLVCVLLFLLTEDHAFLPLAMSLAGIWLGGGLVAQRIMREPVE